MPMVTVRTLVFLSLCWIHTLRFDVERCKEDSTSDKENIFSWLIDIAL